MMHHLLNIISYFMCKSSKPTYKGVDILMISFGVFVSDSQKIDDFGLSFSPDSGLAHTL